MVSDLNIRISHKPNINHLEQIKEWLIKEETEFNSGFYCNWGMISDAFNKKSLIIITLDNKAVGFCIYRVSGKRLFTIEIFSIQYLYRGIGFGKLFYMQIEEQFRQIGSYIITLQCSPAKSERFWKQNKFIEFPKDDTRESIKHKHLYKIIVQTLKQRKDSSKLTNRQVLSLWNSESILCYELPATWSWVLRFEKGSNRLIKPLIFPIDYEWNICYSQGERVFLRGMIKKRLMTNSDCYGFLIVNEVDQSSRSLKDNYLY